MGDGPTRQYRRHGAKHRGPLVCLDYMEPGVTHKAPVHTGEEIHAAPADWEYHAATRIGRVLGRVR